MADTNYSAAVELMLLEGASLADILARTEALFGVAVFSESKESVAPSTGTIPA